MRLCCSVITSYEQEAPGKHRIETVIAMQKGGGIAESNFDIRASFVVGRFPTLKRRLGGTACRRVLKDASRVAASTAGGEGRDRIRFFQCA